MHVYLEMSSRGSWTGTWTKKRLEFAWVCWTAH